MTKKEKIIKTHIKNVYPIKTYMDGDTMYYYTKLNPCNSNHSKKISSKNIDVLNDKIVSYYSDIKLQNDITVYEAFDLSLQKETASTALRYRQLFKKHYISIKNIKLSKLREEHIRNVLQKMIHDGIKAKAFNNAVSALNKIYNYCRYYHIYCINIQQIVSEFRKYNLSGKKVFIRDYKKDGDLAFNEKEAITIINYAFANPDYINLAIATLITTGLRTGELLALKYDDIDLKSQKLIIDKTEHSKSFEIIDSCKDNSERTVFLNSDGSKVFNTLFSVRNNDPAESDFIFLNPNSKDGKLHLRALDNRLRKIQHILFDNDVAICSERSAHDCRRTYASIQYLHGVNIKIIQAQLGHSNVQQTWNYIKNVVDENTRRDILEQSCIL
ncbi:MAG: site-specific integrase [Lachnospiraceae bacterium]|nr:site-specific integrase [Lachnospiraceae bacterium]